MGDTRFVYTTWPDPQTAAEAAQGFVLDRLAACANVLPGALSVYWWEGEVHADTEVVMILKTSTDRMAPLMERFNQVHPSDLPSFVALDIDEARSSPEFLQWVFRESQAETQP